MTVDEFRNIDLERYADPPAYAKEKGGKRRRIKKRKHVDFDDDGDYDQATVISSRAASIIPSGSQAQLATPANAQRQAQIDSQNMPPPPLPIDPNLVEGPGPPPPEPGSSSTGETTKPNMQSSTTDVPTEELISSPRILNAIAISKSPTRRRRGPTSETIAAPALDLELTAALTDPLTMDHACALQVAGAADVGRLSPSSTQQTPFKSRPLISETEEIFDFEFADDPEVANCLLSPEEVVVKTRIWTHENRDYIRAQTAKLLKKQLAEANGTARVIVRRKRKKKRIGDMTDYLGEDGVPGTPVAASTPEAMKMMFKRRGYSTKINYDKFDDLYTPSSSGVSRGGSESGHGGSPGGGMLEQESMTWPDENAMAENGNGDEREEGQGGLEAKEQDEQWKELESIAGELDQEIDESEDDDVDDGEPYGVPDGGEMDYDSD